MVQVTTLVFPCFEPMACSALFRAPGLCYMISQLITPGFHVPGVLGPWCFKLLSPSSFHRLPWHFWVILVRVHSVLNLNSLCRLH